MSVSRRDVISGIGASTIIASLGGIGSAGAGTIHRIEANIGTAMLLEPGEPATPIWGYGGQVPGIEIRTRQGAAFSADLVNKLSQPTTIHWHGIRIDNAMDGVANLTQQAVEAGQTFAYRFTPPDAGTYWYHPHYRTWEQLARGLYGAFIVEEENAPKVDQDRVLIFDDWRIGDDGKIHEASLGGFHDRSHGGRLGNILTLNGAFTNDVAVKSGERLRLRLLNAATARVLRVGFAKHSPRVIALDGQPVEPFDVPKEGILLAPAQRADIMIDAMEDAGTATPIQVSTGRENLEVGRLLYDPHAQVRTKKLNDHIGLPANPLPTGLKNTPDELVELNMTGGAMSWFESASYQGQDYDVRTLARKHGKVWAFNGVAGMPEKPLASLAMGSTVHVKISNRTLWPHAMHFHGHHVKEITHSTRQPHPYWRDTVFLNANETVTVGFHAHNPGKWMLHCHMLAHQLGGMSTWYEVG